jgi:hypothetical protein
MHRGQRAKSVSLRGVHRIYRSLTPHEKNWIMIEKYCVVHKLNQAKQTQPPYQHEDYA